MVSNRPQHSEIGSAVPMLSAVKTLIGGIRGSIAEIERKTGYSHTTISHALSGRYDHDAAKPWVKRLFAEITSAARVIAKSHSREAGTKSSGRTRK